MRPKSKIYTPKRDDEHPPPFHMGVPPLGGAFHAIETRINASLIGHPTRTQTYFAIARDYVGVQDLYEVYMYLYRIPNYSNFL